MPPIVRAVALLVVAIAGPPGCASHGKDGTPVSVGGQGGDGGSGGTGTAGGGAGGGGGGAITADASSRIDDASVDAPMVPADAPASMAADATTDAIIALDDPSTWPGGAYGKPFIVACPDGASRTACCQHYCGCMAKNCGNVSSVRLPADCMAACVAPDAVKGWDLRCRVYNCFESLNPLAQKDRVAHCEHAGARGAGDTYAKCHVAGEPSER
jgi:hypothetical protein